MRKFSHYGLALMTLSAAALLASGCRGGDSPGIGVGNAPPPPAPRRVKVPKARVAAQGDVSALLADLASGDMVRLWTAEEKLGRMGPSVAPQVRSMLGVALPEARAAACRLAYKFEDTEALPFMIELLADESRLVRSTSAVFLRGMTGQDFDYRPDALDSDRAASIVRWREWYAKTHGQVRRRRR